MTILRKFEFDDAIETLEELAAYSQKTGELLKDSKAWQTLAGRLHKKDTWALQQFNKIVWRALDPKIRSRVRNTITNRHARKVTKNTTLCISSVVRSRLREYMENEDIDTVNECIDRLLVDTGC